MCHWVAAYRYTRSGVVGDHALLGIHGLQRRSLFFVLIQQFKERPCLPSCSLNLPEGIAAMRPFVYRVESPNLGKRGEVSARERRHSTREFFDGSEGSLRSCRLKLYGGGLSKATGKAKAKTERKRTVFFAL